MAAYDPVTPAEFKAAKPQFDAVDNATVQQYLDMAALWVDKSWVASSYRPAIIALTCHLMTLAGLGNDADSSAHKDGTAGFQTIKSGTLTLTKFAKDSNQSDYQRWITSTACGEYFWILFQMNKRGPRVAVVSTGICPSPYAKDWPGPVYGWPGVFYS
ncbi:DUF4054 domain-containing protein [Nitratireductor sp. GCM10026969]|uniref:DUF4054 domain-containing protein n=1 Tax=Nitratireductor sp. GCM10026969 TaxID=3252645 RepID=UPI003622D450